MNIQTERIENHRARLTVEVTDKQWKQAKKEAAAALSSRYNIPGFRKGKAPYRIIAKYIGEDSIISDAIDQLGRGLYPQVLEEAEVEPYAAGTIEDFQMEPQPTFVYTVPLSPQVDLGDYQSVRVDYEEPEISDEAINEVLSNLQQEHALVEESANPIQAGDRVTFDIDSTFADGEERPLDDDDDNDEDEDDVVAYKGDTFIQREDIELKLDPEQEPILPGFIDALVGASAGDELEFELTVPDDDEDYEDVGGRKVQFSVIVHKVENITLPELTDDFAARVTEDEDEPLTLLQIRMRIRENMEEEARDKAREAYIDQMVDEIAAQAEIAYPEDMVEDRIDAMLAQLNQQLAQQGLSIEVYQQITGASDESLREEYREEARKAVERSLVFGEVVNAQDIQVTAEEIDAKVDETLDELGMSDNAEVRQLFDQPQQRNNIAQNLLYERAVDMLMKIGKGESLETANDDTSAEDAEAEETTSDAPSASTDTNPETDDAEVVTATSTDNQAESVDEDKE